MTVTLDPEIQQALEKLLTEAQYDTEQGRVVASFLFILWNTGRNARSAVTDLLRLDPEVARACAQLFTWLNDSEVFSDESSDQCINGSAVQLPSGWSMRVDKELVSAVDHRVTADFAFGLWNDRWLMSDEAVSCSYCLATQLPSKADIPMRHYDGCEISSERYPLRDLAAILSTALG